jgi:hypothetical protein
VNILPRMDVAKRLMKFMPAMIFFFGSAAAQAQSLDIGGVELHIGQDVNEALRLLSHYQVQYTGSSWIVTQKAGREFVPLGTISATDNELTFISKQFYSFSRSDGEIYTIASRETRRRGGAACLTREMTNASDQVTGFETQCGIYKLTYYISSRMADGTSIRGGISLYIEKSK